MLIAGAYTSGPQRGNPIEFEPKAKVPHAVQQGARTHTDFTDYLVFVKDVKVENMLFTPKGDLLKKKFQNNTYTAEGNALFYTRHIGTDKSHEPKRKKFKVAFEDTLSPNGLPDIRVSIFDVEPI